MLYTIIIALIILLTILAIMVGAVQQHRQRQNIARRQKIAKYRATLDQVEDLINLAKYFPIGRSMLAVLHSRARELLVAMNEVSPSDSYRERIEEYDQRLQQVDPHDTTLLTENFELPQSDKQIIAMINALKRLRGALRSEHARGKVDSQVYSTEESRLQRLQLKISVETLLKRGQNAYNGYMLGSARQYYEKALNLLDEQTYSDDYIDQRRDSVSHALEQITSELRDANSRDAASQEKDELEELFQPKKKW